LLKRKKLPAFKISSKAIRAIKSLFDLLFHTARHPSRRVICTLQISFCTAQNLYPPWKFAWVQFDEKRAPGNAIKYLSLVPAAESVHYFVFEAGGGRTLTMKLDINMNCRRRLGAAV
jgi:hypothetical protein